MTGATAETRAESWCVGTSVHASLVAHDFHFGPQIEKLLQQAANKETELLSLLELANPDLGHQPRPILRRMGGECAPFCRVLSFFWRYLLASCDRKCARSGMTKSWSTRAA